MHPLSPRVTLVLSLTPLLAAVRDARLIQVFGGKDGRFRADWFVPYPAQFPGSMTSDIMGYRIEVRLGIGV